MANDMNDMTTALSICIDTRTPVLVAGKPGTAKTSILTAIAETKGLPIETILGSIREPADYGGLPVVQDDGTVKLAPAAWWQRCVSAGEKSEGNRTAAVVFHDEINAATPTTMKALLRGVLEGVFGDLPGRNIAHVAAMNPGDQVSGVFELDPALANRFVHIPWELDPEAWSMGMLTGFAPPQTVTVPEDWAEEYLPEARAHVAGFVQHRPELFLKMPKDDASRAGAWPSPRSWTVAANLLAASRAVEVSYEVLTMLLAGAVGNGAAVEFLAFIRDQDLPSPEEVIANPKGIKVPDRGDRCWAVVGAVASAVSQPSIPKSAKVKDPVQRWYNACEYLERVADFAGDDLTIPAIQVLLAHRPTGKHVLPNFIMRVGSLVTTTMQYAA